MNKAKTNPSRRSSSPEDSLAHSLYTEVIEQYEAEAKERLKAKLKPKKWTRLRVLSVLSVVLVLLWSAQWLIPAPNDLPNEVVGMWRTTSPVYADRFIQIGQITISFGVGNAKVASGFIKEVEIIPEATRTLYNITYLQNGEKLKISFYHVTGRGTLLLKNQQGIVWKREVVAESASGPTS